MGAPSSIIEGIVLKARLWCLYIADDRVTVLESEKRAWENSPEAQAVREALNPWRNRDAESKKNP